MAIKISRKDKSLLLFIAALFVVLWFIFSFLTNLIFSSAFAVSDASKIISAYGNDQERWLNLSRPLRKKDLKDRIILLDFWTHACVNCLHVIPEIKKLEKEFGNKLLVIGVHSGKFDNEKDIKSIKKAVLKYKIDHPVVNDSEMKIWDEFKVRAWPSLVLIDPRGEVRDIFVGEGDVRHVRRGVKKMVKKYRYHLNRENPPILPERHKIVKTVLSYPTKMTYTKKFNYRSYSGEAFFIANTGRNSVLAVRKNGEVIVQIGSKDPGFQDGVIEVAKFKSPSGLLFKDDVLYVADTGNHALRKIDFKKNIVENLVGNRKRGNILVGKNVRARDVSLASPTDLEFYPDKDHIAIANSGTHQILSYDVKKGSVSVLAGNGYESIDDGKYPHNSLAQTSDLSAYDGKLYFLDSETSSLRVLNKEGKVKTLIGKGLFDFGHKNGTKEEALMQHPLGLFVNKRGVYISDSFNHKIRKYQPKSEKIKDLFGSSRGDDLGKEMKFDEPDDILVIKDQMYIVDTNNNRIVRINFDNMKAYLFNVMPALRLPKEGFLQYLPNLNKLKQITVKNKDVDLKLSMDKSLKLNEKGPSFLNLLEKVNTKKANLVKTFDWNMIKNGEMKLPKLDRRRTYILQGTIYFCKNKTNSLCYISSYEQEILVDDSGKKIVKIEI